MMKSEFIERVGLKPTDKEYEQIEQSYYNFDGNKDEFCKYFIENNGILKICVAREKKAEQLQSRILELEKMIKDEGERIAELESTLDKELEWRDCEPSTLMNEEQYAELENTPETKKLTDDEAKQELYAECGFVPEMIRIIREGNAYEINRHGRTREKRTYNRSPLYYASDWNYIKFMCAGYMYEYVNGDLNPCDW